MGWNHHLGRSFLRLGRWLAHRFKGKHRLWCWFVAGVGSPFRSSLRWPPWHVKQIFPSWLLQRSCCSCDLGKNCKIIHMFFCGSRKTHVVMFYNWFYQKCLRTIFHWIHKMILQLLVYNAMIISEIFSEWWLCSDVLTVLKYLLKIMRSCTGHH